MKTLARPRDKSELLRRLRQLRPDSPPRPGILTSPEIDQERGGTRPADFAADVARLETLVEVIAAAPPGTFAAQAHPIFGRMSDAAWLRWGYLHMDHHLRQFGA